MKPANNKKSNLPMEVGFFRIGIILAFILVTLKLAGVISLPWILVTFPLWGIIGGICLYIAGSFSLILMRGGSVDDLKTALDERYLNKLKDKEEE